MASLRPQTGEQPSGIPTDGQSLVAPAAARPANLLIFRLAGDRFGFRLGMVAEIIRLPNLAHMPLVPPSLLGLANLGGVVLPVVSLRSLLRLPELAASPLTRVVVTRGDTPVGFVVDSIDRLLTMASDQIEQGDAAAGTLDKAALDGLIKGAAEGQGPIRLLNPSHLLRGPFARLGLSATPAASQISFASSGSVEKPARTRVALLSLHLGAQEYALPLDRVREIIALPDRLAELPRSETAVLGVVTLRNRLLPVVSLRALLGIATTEQLGQSSKIIVMPVGEGIVGVVVDATREILRLDPDVIDPAPALLTRGGGDAEIVSICRLDGGRRLVALLSPERLFRSDLVRRILDEQQADAAEPPEAIAMADEPFIIFRLGDQDYGMTIAVVREIVRPPAHVTRLPKAPGFIDGVMNLRGSVVPIVDLRRRFDLDVAERAGAQRILVLAIGGVIAGFLVDSVCEIMKIPIDSIHSAPELSPDQMRLISRVVNLQAAERLILLVEPAQLLNQIETEVLARFNPSERDASVAAS